MKRALLTLAESDYEGLVAYMEHFVRGLLNARDVADVNIAAGTFIQEVKDRAQEVAPALRHGQ